MDLNSDSPCLVVARRPKSVKPLQFSRICRRTWFWGAAMDGRYRLQLIGPFGLFSPAGCRIEISSRKSVALLALLATSPGGVRTRRWLRQMLWSESTEAQGQASLRRELSTLAQILERHGAGSLLVREMQRVSLAVEQLSVDVFFHGIENVPYGTRSGGDFLEGLDLPNCEEFEDWLRVERSRLCQIGEASERGLETRPDGPRRGADVVRSGVSTSRPPKPSVAILPFADQRSAGSPKGLGSALAEELTAQLCRFPQLFVFSRNTARRVLDEDLPPEEFAARLGAHYVIDGSIFSSGDRLRLSIRIVAGASGEQLWAERFEGTGHDLLDLQDKVATLVAPRVWTHVDAAERQIGLRSSGTQLDDYQLYWRANALMRVWDQEGMVEAVSLLDKLTGNTPACPWATSLAAYCHSLIYLLGKGLGRETSRRRAVHFVQTAMRTGPDNAETLGYCAGTIINLGGDIEIADRLVARALAQLPDFQPTLFWGGWVDIARGEATRARTRFERALSINPVSGARGETLCGVGFSYLIERDARSALPFFIEGLDQSPRFPPLAVGASAAAWHVGDTELAKRFVSFLPRETAKALAGILRREDDRTYLNQALSSAREWGETRSSPGFP